MILNYKQCLDLTLPYLTGKDLSRLNQVCRYLYNYSLNSADDRWAQIASKVFGVDKKWESTKNLKWKTICPLLKEISYSLNGGKSHLIKKSLGIDVIYREIKFIGRGLLLETDTHQMFVYSFGKQICFPNKNQTVLDSYGNTFVYTEKNVPYFILADGNKNLFILPPEGYKTDLQTAAVYFDEKIAFEVMNTRKELAIFNGQETQLLDTFFDLNEKHTLSRFGKYLIFNSNKGIQIWFDNKSIHLEEENITFKSISKETLIYQKNGILYSFGLYTQIQTPLLRPEGRYLISDSFLFRFTQHTIEIKELNSAKTIGIVSSETVSRIKKLGRGVLLLEPHKYSYFSFLTNKQIIPKDKTEFKILTLFDEKLVGLDSKNNYTVITFQNPTIN